MFSNSILKVKSQRHVVDIKRILLTSGGGYMIPITGLAACISSSVFSSCTDISFSIGGILEKVILK